MLKKLSAVYGTCLLSKRKEKQRPVSSRTTVETRERKGGNPFDPRNQLRKAKAVSFREKS